MFTFTRFIDSQNMYVIQITYNDENINKVNKIHKYFRFRNKEDRNDKVDYLFKLTNNELLKIVME